MKLSRRNNSALYVPKKRAGVLDLTFTSSDRIFMGTSNTVGTETRITILNPKGSKIRESVFASKDKKGQAAAPRIVQCCPTNQRMVAVVTSDVISIYDVGTGTDPDYKPKKVGSIDESNVIAMIWTTRGAGSTVDCIYIATRNGDVKRIDNPTQSRSGRSDNRTTTTLYGASSTVSGRPLSPVNCLAVSPDGHTVYSGHWRREIVAYDVVTESLTLVGLHPSPPVAIAPTRDGQVAAISGDAKDPNLYLHSTTRAAPLVVRLDVPTPTLLSLCGPRSGDSVVVCAPDSIFVVAPVVGEWRVDKTIPFSGMGAIPACAFSLDSSALVVGSSTGVVELFDVCVAHTVSQGFDVLFRADNRVEIKGREGDPRAVTIASHHRTLSRVRVHRSLDTIATAFGGDTPQTPRSVIFANLDTGVVIEAPWSAPDVRFILDTPGIAIMFVPGDVGTSGDIYVIDISGEAAVDPADAVLGPAHTPRRNRSLISALGATLDGLPQMAVAHVGDVGAKTIIVTNISACLEHTRYTHVRPVRWLELNATARQMLFQDVSGAVWVLGIGEDMLTQPTVAQLSQQATYVQWVPGTDVVVAQCGPAVHTWYSLGATRADVTPLRDDGCVVDIERSEHSTEVVVECPDGREYRVPLDDTLIRFNTAMASDALEQAAASLPTDSSASQAKGMWRQLLARAIALRNLPVAIQAAAASHASADLHYLEACVKTEIDAFEGTSSDRSRLLDARMALMDREQVDYGVRALVGIGKYQEAIDVYVTLGQYPKALSLAAELGLPADTTDALKQQYLTLLESTKQFIRIGEMREAEHAYVDAVATYLRGGAPHIAARLIMSGRASMTPDAQASFVDQICAMLESRSQFKELGQFYEYLGRNDDAFRLYKRGNVYPLAIKLARDGQGVVTRPEFNQLLSAYGRQLARQGQPAKAVTLFEEAGDTVGAVDSAIAANQISKAEDLLARHAIDERSRSTFTAQYIALAEHYEGKKNLVMAEGAFVNAGQVRRAVLMHVGAGDVSSAISVANRMPEAERRAVLREVAGARARARLFDDAKALYSAAGDVDAIIGMFKAAAMFDQCIAAINANYAGTRRAALVADVARDCVQLGRLSDARRMYLIAGLHEEAITMYKGLGKWTEAIDVAQQADPAVLRKLAFEYGVQEGSRGLTAVGLVGPAVQHAIDHGDFAKAELFAENSPELKAEICLGRARHLENEGLVEEAQEQFIAGGKPEEAVHMWVHLGQFDSALKVAGSHAPGMVTEVKQGMAAHYAASNHASDLNKAVELFVELNEHDKALEVYTSRGMTAQALLLAQRHVQLQHHVDSMQTETRAQPRVERRAVQPSTVMAEAEASLTGVVRSGDVAHALGIIRGTSVPAEELNAAAAAARRTDEVSHSVVAFAIGSKLTEMGLYGDAINAITDVAISAEAESVAVITRLADAVIRQEFPLTENDAVSPALVEYELAMPGLLRVVNAAGLADSPDKAHRDLAGVVLCEAMRVRFSPNIAENLAVDADDDEALALAAKAALSALEFAGTLLPIDRAYFFATLLCIRAGRLDHDLAPTFKSMAFFVGNRYRDVHALANHSPDVTYLDNADVQDACINWPMVGIDSGAGVSVVSVPFINDDEYADRDAPSLRIFDDIWGAVDDLMIDAGDPPQQPCESCYAEHYAFNTVCPHCGFARPRSSLSGAPITPPETVCGSCGARSGRREWNLVASRGGECSVCGESAVARH
ncbi:intraflagellar transport [Carpediemonas membranifera]|uniref:Intraflagellar transport n=1 Tax=Carpediemonas membranifera TaxID=201153 RepID=A0A8J6ARV6_9EUKA|nr:intraflagellar transport [Carpediemonas membranifera]|eukprot:KAG9392443.1 intraflagellar transport [Carpediemonas membranifera]